jgi:hypothetical protein
MRGTGPSPPGSLDSGGSGGGGSGSNTNPKSQGKGKETKKKGWFSNITSRLGITAEADESGTYRTTAHVFLSNHQL